MGEEVRFKAYEQHQGELFPGHLSAALDPSDPVFFPDDVVEALDLAGRERRYARRGENAHRPRMLLTVWLFGAIEGVYSGRELARRLRWDLRFRYLAGGLYPDFRTINRFRVLHREDFAEVLRQTVHLARAAGLAKLGRVVVDGSKLRANTSRHKAMSHERMQAMEDNLARLRRRGQRCLVATGRESLEPRRWPLGRETQGERPFAEIEQTMGRRRFQLRGLGRVRAEWDLVSAASNVRTLYRAALAV